MQKTAIGAGNLTLQGVQDGVKHMMTPRAPTPPINLKNPLGTTGFQGLGKNVSDMVSGAKQTAQKQLSQVPDLFNNGPGSFGGGGGFDPRMFEELYRQHQQRGMGAQAAEIGGATGLGLGAGALLGGAAGSLVGYGRGNTPEGLGRGVVRGGATGAGLLGGAALGQAIGNHINPQYGGLGAALGGAAGGLLGYGGSGLLMGEPEAERRKKQQVETMKMAEDAQPVSHVYDASPTWAAYPEFVRDAERVDMLTGRDPRGADPTLSHDLRSWDEHAWGDLRQALNNRVRTSNNGVSELVPTPPGVYAMPLKDKQQLHRVTSAIPSRGSSSPSVSDRLTTDVYSQEGKPWQRRVTDTGHHDDGGYHHVTISGRGKPPAPPAPPSVQLLRAMNQSSEDGGAAATAGGVRPQELPVSQAQPSMRDLATNTGLGLGAGALVGGAAGAALGGGRGAIQGGATGAGALGGGVVGHAIGSSIDPQYGGIGAVLGGAAGGLLGYGGSNLLMGAPEAERRKKQQVETMKTAEEPESLVPPNPFKGYLTDEKYHEIRTDPRVREAQLNASRYGYQDMIDTRKREALERFYRWKEQNSLTEYGLGGVAANTGAGLGAGALVGGAVGAALGGGRGAIQGGATGAGALGGGVVGHAIGSSINPQYGGLGAVLGGAAGGLLGYGGSNLLLGEPEAERRKKQEAAKVAAALVAPTSANAVTGGAATSAPKPATAIRAPMAGPINNMQDSRRRTMGRATGAV